MTCPTTISIAVAFTALLTAGCSSSTSDLPDTNDPTTTKPAPSDAQMRAILRAYSHAIVPAFDLIIPSLRSVVATDAALASEPSAQWPSAAAAFRRSAISIHKGIALATNAKPPPGVRKAHDAWVKGVGHYDRVLFRVAGDLKAGHYARATRDVNRLTRAEKTASVLTRKLLARFKAVACAVRPDIAGC